MTSLFRPRPFRALLVAGALAGAAGAQTNIFEMPRLQPRQARLAREFQRHLAAGDFAAMETVCREGLELLPQNPTWLYNLACSLARQGKHDEALAALAEAIKHGFHDAQAIARDPDLASLRRSARFAALLAEARRRHDQPLDDVPLLRPAPVVDVALVSASNTTWHFELGRFQTFFTIAPRRATDTNMPVALPGAAGEAIRAWQAEGTAAGNHGDLYENRDDGHSRLNLGLFPEMKPVVFDEEARRAGVHVGLAQFMFNGAVTIGNSSTARTDPLFWCSIPRAAYLSAHETGFLALQYLRNQLYVYPQHRDYRADVEGDVFPAATPYLLIAPGSSFSDQPLLEAVAATLAAFRPEVKAHLARRGTLMPVIQMLLRAGQRDVARREDYLTRRAHPVVFDAARLDLPRVVTMAHDLRTNALPPLALLRLVEEGPPAVPGRDFFDLAAGEQLFDTPAAIARVARGMACTRRIVVNAADSHDPQDWPLRWHWFLLQGDPAKVRLKPRPPAGAVAEIEVDYHGGAFLAETNSRMRSSRVEIAVCADNGRHFSPPAFVTVLFLNNELREYAADGRIIAVDYAAAARRYTDPRLSLPRRWRDLYLYDTRNRMIGWTRLRGAQTESFTADGARVLSRDALGRPATARTVRYLPRATGEPGTLPEIVAVDGETVRFYRYAADDDFVGEIAAEKPAGQSPDAGR
jgi:hypothetical protein